MLLGTAFNAGYASRSNNQDVWHAPHPQLSLKTGLDDPATQSHNLVVSVILDLIFQETAASDRAGFPVIQSTVDASITAKGRDACFCGRRPCDCMVITKLKDQAVTGSAAGDCCFEAL